MCCMNLRKDGSKSTVRKEIEATDYEAFGVVCAMRFNCPDEHV